MRDRRIWLHCYLPFILFTSGLIVLSIGAFLIPNWFIISIESLFQVGMTTVILTCIFIVTTIISIIFIIKKPDDSSESGGLLIESKLNTWIDNKIKILMVIALIINAVSFAPLFLLESQFVSDWLLAFDIVEILSIILNLMLIRYFSTCYHNDIRKNKLKQNLLSIGNNLLILLLIFKYGGIIIILLFQGGIFPATMEFVTFLYDLRNILAMIFHGLFILICVGTLIKPAKLQEFHKEKQTGDGEILFGNSPFFSFIVKFFRSLIFVILYFLFSIAVLVSIYIVTGDFIMFFTYFSVPFTVGLLIPIILSIIKAVEESTLKNRFYKIKRLKLFSILIIVINLLPVIFTPLYPTFSLDAQFADIFGLNWNDSFTEDEMELLETTRYSFLKNIYPKNISINAEYNISYTQDFPYRISGNTSTVKHTFYYDSYLPSWRKFGTESEPSLEPLPVIILMHGEVEDNGPWNANLTSQILANKGYLVCDMDYGYITHNQHGANNNGYLLIQVIEQLAEFTKQLYLNRTYFHADMNKTYFAGRHLGGGLAIICGHGYNSTLKGMFEPNMRVKGVIGFYPLSDLGCSDCMFYQIKSDPDNTQDNPYMNGSSNPADPNYDPNWDLLNPIDIVKNVNSPMGSLAPTLIFCGTHDYMIPYAHNQNFVKTLKDNGHDVISAYYLLGSDGFDGAFISQWGQNVMYYLERFLLLTQE